MDASESRSILAALTSKFYTIIPHNFGRNLPPIIVGKDMLQKKFDMLIVCAMIMRIPLDQHHYGLRIALWRYSLNQHHSGLRLALWEHTLDQHHTGLRIAIWGYTLDQHSTPHWLK